MGLGPGDFSGPLCSLSLLSSIQGGSSDWLRGAHLSLRAGGPAACPVAGPGRARLAVKTLRFLES